MAKRSFFSRQEQLSRQLWIIGIGGATALGLLAAWAGWVTAVIGWAYGSRLLQLTPELLWWQERLPLYGAAVVLLLVGLLVLWYFVLLRRNLAAQVQQLGATEIVRRMSTTPAAASRLLNVIDELSLASRLPAPRLFLLESDVSINSYSIMSNTGERLLILTQGAVDQLSRDELQALCAQEFAHMEYGASEANVALLALTRGLRSMYVLVLHLLKGVAGLRALHPGLILLLPLAALAFAPLFMIGVVGLGLAEVIPLLVTRRRVLLADAGALEFIRDKQALVDLLNKAWRTNASLLGAGMSELRVFRSMGTGGWSSVGQAGLQARLKALQALAG